MADTAGASLESPPQDFEDRQTQKFTGAVGNSLPLEAILNLYDFFVDARPPKKYEDFSRIRFVYEILYKDEWKEKVKHIACTWLEDDANVRRAAAQVGRQPAAAGIKLLGGWCAFRLKGWSGNTWSAAPDFRIDSDSDPQTVVFLALEDLNSSNGFFMRLDRGHDVCLDSRAEIKFPSSGGGLGIFFSVKL